mmetsp:Transcript_2288/g.4248  ORF Transcript_2288/g.4248 Transcript_2288/m.4248 type:complete len:102 (+) Transcript_2288:2760-3065(+)
MATARRRKTETTLELKVFMLNEMTRRSKRPIELLKRLSCLSKRVDSATNENRVGYLKEIEKNSKIKFKLWHDPEPFPACQSPLWASCRHQYNTLVFCSHVT